MLQSLLDQLIPFRFLSATHRRWLVERVTLEEVDAETVVFEQGALDEKRLYFVLEGAVEVIDTQHNRSLGVIEAGRYFGERAPLFDIPRAHTIRTLYQPARLASVSREDFLHLMSQDAAFAHAFGAILREKQGLFRAFEAFVAELMHGVSEDVVHFRQLVRLYRHLEPALHRHVTTTSLIDFEALSYAMKRLPDDISSTYMLYLTDSLQEHLDAPSHYFDLIETPARRRVIYRMAPGKLMVILRDGVSDLIDLVTCLCTYSVEAKKLRRRIQHPHHLKTLAAHVAALATGERCEVDEEEQLLTALGFEPAERQGLARLYSPGLIAPALYRIALHHEDFNIQITKQIQGYHSVHAEIWTDQIVHATLTLMGCRPEALHDVDVHILSSNTHSVGNCLGTYLFERREAIEAWGRVHQPQLFEAAWHIEEDRLYALARAWFVAHPEERELRAEHEREGGIVRLGETALTGIGVELIDLSRVDLARVDPNLAALANLSPDQPVARRALVVNIDYAFGQQAEEILGTLLALFGQQVRSVNILGKAGALCGERGDVLVATSFVEQTSEILGDIPNQNSCDIERLRQLMPDRNVHVGPVLTVAGTLLQNRVLLNFYRHVWRCIGLEMEGTYYLRELKKAIHLGVIPEDVTSRFVYYVSDLPLRHDATLAGGMAPHEGIPPLYAITREILAAVLASTR